MCVSAGAAALALLVAETTRILIEIGIPICAVLPTSKGTSSPHCLDLANPGSRPAIRQSHDRCGTARSRPHARVRKGEDMQEHGETRSRSTCRRGSTGLEKRESKRVIVSTGEGVSSIGYPADREGLGLGGGAPLSSARRIPKRQMDLLGGWAVN
jgi:hypothetical protein